MDKLLFNKLAQQRNSYFFDRGLGTAPLKQEDRLQEAYHYIKQEKPDYETAYQLYDKIEDCVHAEFLNVMGFIHAQENSPYFDHVAAFTYFKKAYIYAEDDAQKIYAADHYLTSYFALHKITSGEYGTLYKDPFVLEFLLLHYRLDLTPGVFQRHGAAEPMTFLKGIMLGAGHGFPRNDSLVHQIYSSYIEEQEQGYLSAAYKNLAIRCSLGLGCDANPGEGFNIVRIGWIMLQGHPYNSSDYIVKALSRYANSSTTNRLYNHTRQRIAKFCQETESPWACLNFMQFEKNIDRAAIADTIYLTAILAQNENWSNYQDWQKVSHYACTSAYGSEPNFGRGDLLGIETFNPLVLQREPDRLRWRPFKIKLYEYFLSHNLGLPPTAQEDRLDMAYYYYQKNPKNYEIIFILHDPEEDAKHSNWLLFLGNVHDDDVDNPYFDPELSFEYFKRSSRLGNPAASSNIGLKYEQGRDTSIDLNEALIWHELSRQQGGNRAAGSIARIKLLMRGLDNPASNPVPTEDIFLLYKESADKLDLPGWIELARCQINGTGTEKNVLMGIENYKKILSFNPKFHEQSSHASLALVTAQRYFLGLDVPQDLRAALGFLNLVSNSKEGFIQNILVPKIEELRNIINEDKYGNKWKHAKDFVARIHNNNLNPADQIFFITQSKNTVTKELLDVMSIVYQISHAEKWANKKQWQDLYEAVLAKRIDLTHTQTTLSTLVSGPRYTPLDRNGLPVLGVWEQAAPDESIAEKHRVSQGSFVPPAGVIAIRGITAHPVNGISFHVVESNDLPAMLIQQDFDVAMALCFAYDRVMWPVLSLEDVEDEEIHIDKSLLQRKVFFPEWLGHSEFGKTLFTTDQLIGNWAWQSETYAVGNPAETFKENAHDIAKAFIRDVRLTGGRVKDGSSRRVMLNPESFKSHIYVRQDGENATIHVDIAELKMRVDGSYILKEDRLIALNDTNFEQGRICQKLTDNYNVIASLDPRFERAKQLMRLLYALADLREKTQYELPPSQKQHVIEEAKKYERLGALPKHFMICRRIPLMR